MLQHVVFLSLFSRFTEYVYAICFRRYYLEPCPLPQLDMYFVVGKVAAFFQIHVYSFDNRQLRVTVDSGFTPSYLVI